MTDSRLVTATENLNHTNVITTPAFLPAGAQPSPQFFATSRRPDHNTKIKFKSKALPFTANHANPKKMVSISRFAILAMAIVSGLALGTPLDSPQATNFTLAKREHFYYCGLSTYENQNSLASPSVSDCLQIATNIDRDGNWHFTDCSQRQILQYGSCKFGVEGAKESCLHTLIIGNGDVIRIIKASVDKFQFEGRVGTMGYVDCGATGLVKGTVSVQWGLY